MSANQDIMPFLLEKVEPLSPSGSSSFDIDEEWRFEEKPTILTPDGWSLEISQNDKNATASEVAASLLNHLNSELWIKQGLFATWHEEKIDLPIFEDLAGPEYVGVPSRSCANIDYSPINKQHLTTQHQFNQHSQPQPQQHLVHHQQQLPLPQQYHQQPQQDQQQDPRLKSLLQEFDNVFGDVKLSHNSCVNSVSTLTPPQTPPPPGQSYVSLQPVQKQPQHPVYVYEQHLQPQLPQILHTQLEQQVQQPDQLATNLYINQLANLGSLENQWGAENLSVHSLVGDSASSGEEEVVTQQELADVQNYVRSCTEDVGPSSPCASTSDSTNSSEDLSDQDPDWSIDSSSTIYSEKSNVNNKTKTLTKSRGGGRRSRPYSRPNSEDKRMRKKEQNKNAATRYRQKKKAEIKEIIGEEQELVNYNEKLHSQVNDLQREVGYLKGLMRDLCKAKGLI